MNDALQFQSPAGLKISVSIQPDVSDEYLQFLSQMGVGYCYTWVEDHQTSYDFIAALKDRLQKYGITLYNVGNMSLGKSPAILLGLPERDRELEKFRKFLSTLNRADIHTTTVTWEPNNTLSTTPDGRVVSDRLGGSWANVETRGGALARVVDIDVLNVAKPTQEKIYTKEEIWDNFKYFTKAVVPAAEENKIRIALHPNDPPVPSCLGIATLITSHEDYIRAFDIADSDYFGMEFCVGCWLEGGRSGFGDVYKSIREFVKMGKVFIVHFRNVTGTVPYFVETFVDDGYQDMYDIMKAFVKSGYNGTLTMDHTPKMVPLAGAVGETAYAVGYLKALYQAASDECLRQR